MKKNIDLVADSDNLAIDIACYEKLFTDYIGRLDTEERIAPEITGPILAAYKADPKSIFGTMLYAFIGGFEAGADLALDIFKNPNLTNIE